MVTASTDETPPRGIKLEPVALVDMSTMSQSELHSLSLCSESSFNLRCTDDLVIPEINRSIFSDSGGSHRQTYSAARRDDSSTTIGHRSSPICCTPPLASVAVDDDQEIAEDKSIVNYLKELTEGKKIKKSSADKLIKKSSANKLLLPPRAERFISRDSEAAPELKNEEAPDMQVVFHSGEREREREEQKPNEEVPENHDEIQLEIVNQNEVPIDLKKLEIAADDLYGAELGRRTAGLKTKEEVLGFLRKLEGQWGSTRKKKKMVDASKFGDTLPVGWKLLLRVKKSKGRPFLHCRSYISPNGQQFESCKEAASYLRSYFNDATQPLNQTGGNNQQVQGVASDNQHAGSIRKNDDAKEDFFPNSTIPSSSMPNVQEEELSLVMDIDNLPEVRVGDLFECYKCNINFDKKDSYLKHLMLYHPTTTRRYRRGSSTGEGAVNNDGHHECQICHKVFEERQSYNGHIEAHVRNNGRTYGELPGQATLQKSTKSCSRDGLPPRPPPRISKMDALTEIAQRSISEISTAAPNDKANNRSSPKAVEVVPIPESHATKTGHKLSLGSDSNEKKCRTKSKTDSLKHKRIDEEKGNNGHRSHVKGSTEGLVRSESEAAGVNIAKRRHFRTVCVWCRKDFNYVVVDPESQSDSVVGFMCRACKSKISGQLNKLGNYLSKNPDL